MKERFRRLTLLGLAVATVTTSALPVSAAELPEEGELELDLSNIVADEVNDDEKGTEGEKKKDDITVTTEDGEKKDEEEVVADPATKSETVTPKAETPKVETPKVENEKAADVAIDFEVADLMDGVDLLYEEGQNDLTITRKITAKGCTDEDIKAGTELEVTKFQVGGSDVDKEGIEVSWDEDEDGDLVVKMVIPSSVIDDAMVARAKTISVSAEVAVTGKAGYTVAPSTKIAYDLDVNAYTEADQSDVKLSASTAKPTVTFDGNDVDVTFEYTVEGINADSTQGVLSFDAEKFAIDGKEIKNAIKNANGTAVVTKVSEKKHTVKVTYTIDKNVLLANKITTGTYEAQMNVIPKLSGVEYKFSDDSNIDATKLRVFTLKSTVDEAEVPTETQFTIPEWAGNNTDTVSMTFNGTSDIVYEYSFKGAPVIDKKLNEFLAAMITAVKVDGETVDLDPIIDIYDKGTGDRGVKITFSKDKLLALGLENGAEPILSWRVVFSSTDKDVQVNGAGTIDDGAFKFKYNVGDKSSRYILELEKWPASDTSTPSYTFRGDKDIEYTYSIDLTKIGDVPYNFTEYMDAKVTGVYLNNKVCNTTPTVSITQDGNTGKVKLAFNKDDIIAMGFQRHARPILTWNIEFTSKKDDVELTGEGVKDESGFMFDYQYQTNSTVDATKANANNVTSAPKTGDTTDAASQGILMLGSLAVVAEVLKRRKECLD